MAFTQSELADLLTLANREGTQAVVDALFEQLQKAREAAAFETINALTSLTVSDFAALTAAVNNPATQALTVERCMKGFSNALANANASRLCTWAICLAASVKGRFNL